MKSFRLHLCTFGAVLVGSLSLSSCGDDPEQLAKLEKQNAEIVKLDAEYDVLKDRYDNMPKDRSEELTNLKKEAADNEQAVAALETEIEALKAKKAEVDKSLADYRQKYRLR